MYRESAAGANDTMNPTESISHRVIQEAKGVAIARATHEVLLQRARKVLEEQTVATVTTAQNRIREQQARFRRQVDAELGVLARPWDDPGWATYSPSSEAPLAWSRVTRLGTFQQVLALGADGRETAEFPALIPILGHRSLVIRGPGSALGPARALLQSIAFRLLVSTPPGRVRFTLIDHVGVGQNLRLLLELDEMIRGRSAWSSTADIAESLREVRKMMEDIVQTRLINRHDNIETYNVEAGVDGEPYRVVVISDFPKGFKDEAIEHLQSIIENGPRAGIYVLAAWDTVSPAPRSFSEERFTAHTSIVELNQDRFSVRGLRFEDVTLVADPIPDRELVKRQSEDANAGARQAKNVVVHLDECLPKQPWSGRSDTVLQAPIGRLGTSLQNFTLGADGVHHALIAGMTGSGKSFLLHAIILSLCFHYSPAELQLYLLDFKQGVEFRPYARLPHARVVALSSEREFGLSVLDDLVAEMDRRGKLFTDLGVSRFEDARERLRTRRQDLPRILVIVDEFQVYFEEKDMLSRAAQARLDALARKARGLGIHLMLATQSMPADMSPGVLGQFGLRIALRMAKSTSGSVLAEGNDDASMLERAGQAIYNNSLGQSGSNKRFQSAYLPPDDRDRYVNALCEYRNQLGLGWDPLIFDGDSPATLLSNRDLTSRLRGGPPAEMPLAVPLFLGEPVRVAERHTAFRLQRQQGSQLLLIGSDEETAHSIILGACVSLLAHTPEGGVKLAIADMTKRESPVHGKFAHLQRLRKDVAWGDRARLEDYIAEFSRQLQVRIAADQNNEEIGCTWVLVIFGIQSAMRLRKENNKIAPAAASLANIISQGPALGLHVIVWSSKYETFTDVIESKYLREFTTRVVGAGAPSDNPLIKFSSALKPFYAVYQDIEDNDDPVKLRCYGRTVLEWLDSQGGA
jgi:S-DNA-T family DNA segregation ATPase FtsK/SpoIIIE